MIICYVLPKWCGCVEIFCFLEKSCSTYNAIIEFNQDMSEFARECRNRL
jgi:hypothetical protein